MVNIAMMMATGAEQGGMPRQPGTPAAGATPVSFHESFEGSVGAGLGKRSTLPVTTTNSAGIKGAALRIGLIRVDGDGAASLAKMPADLRETGFEKPLGSSKGSESSEQGVVATDLKKEDTIQSGSAAVVEDVPSNLKAIPAQRVDAESLITSTGQERRAQESAVAPVHESRAETAAKVKPGSRKDEASSDAPAVQGETAGMNMLPDPLSLSLAGQPAEYVAPVAASSIRESVKDSTIQNVSATGKAAVGANKRAHSLKSPVLPKEKPEVEGAEERSGKAVPQNDGVGDKSVHADDSQGSFAHGSSTSLSEPTGKPHEISGGEIQAMPSSPLTKDQAHTLTESSAGREVSVSGNSHASLRGEMGAFEAGASVSEHRALAASPTMLEVGVPGGSHGWLKIRAELTGDGAVHASVSSNSAAAAEMLRRELPSLTTYLHQEQVSVGSLVVHASASTQDSSMSSGAGESGVGHQQRGDAHHGRGQQEGGSYREWSEGSWADGTEENGLAAWLPRRCQQAMAAG